MKKNFFAIALSGIIGLIVGLPHLVIPRLILPKEYDPLQFTYGLGSSITMEEVYTYAPEVQDILEGSRFVSDSQVYEYRATRTPFIGESGDAWIVALLARLSGSLEGGFIASDFVFPFLTFLLVYFLTLFLSRETSPQQVFDPEDSDRGAAGHPLSQEAKPRTESPVPQNHSSLPPVAGAFWCWGNKIIAVGTAAIVVLWSELIALIPYPHAIWTSFVDAFHPRDFLIVSRSFHPQVSLPLYFLAVVLVIVAVRKKRWWISVVAGVVGGFMFYTYVFAWTAFLAGFGLFSVIALVRRQSGVLKHVVIVAVVMSVIALPYVDTARKFQQSGRSSDFFQKLSLPKRGFIDLVARHAVFIGLYIMIRRKRWTINDWCFLAFWIAPLVLPNVAQEILGRDLEGKHWIRRIGYPMSTIAFGITASSLVPKRMLRSVGVVVTSIVLFRAIVLQYTMTKQSAETYRRDEQKTELFDWINQNTELGTVIASLDWDVIASLPAKTHAFNFAPIGMRTVASTDETIERYLWTYALFGASREAVDFSFSDPTLNGQSGIAVSRAVYFLYAQPDKVFTLPPEIKTDILNRYDATTTSVRFVERPPFRLDYLLLGSFEKQIKRNNDIATNPRSLVFRNASFELYQFPMLQSGE